MTNTSSSSRQGVIHHPRLGAISTYVFEKKRNIRHYFDEFAGNWFPLPLSWELLVPQVRGDVQQIQSFLPQWDSIDEIILALREHSYDAQDTLNWKMDDSARELFQEKLSTTVKKDGKENKELLQKV